MLCAQPASPPRAVASRGFGPARRLIVLVIDPAHLNVGLDPQTLGSLVVLETAPACFLRGCDSHDGSSTSADSPPTGESDSRERFTPRPRALSARSDAR